MRKFIPIIMILITISMSGCVVPPDETKTNVTARDLEDIGEEGNLWDNESTGINEPSDIVYTRNYPHISIFGEVSSSTTLEVYVSQDGENFYLCNDLTSRLNSPSGNQVHIYFTAGAKYYYLQSESNVTANYTLSAKP